MMEELINGSVGTVIVTWTRVYPIYSTLEKPIVILLSGELLHNMRM
jgi:hypothetical protein